MYGKYDNIHCFRSETENYVKTKESAKKHVIKYVEHVTIMRRNDGQHLAHS